MTTTKDRSLLTFQSGDDAKVNNVRNLEGAPTVIGYQPGTSDGPQAVQGDNKFPYFKDPPDNSIVYQLHGLVYVGLAGVEPVATVLPDSNLPFAEDSPVPLIDAFVTLPELDVRPIRALAVFIEYFSNNGMLEMIVEGGIRIPSQPRLTKWFPLGVVDSSLDGAPTPNLFLPGGAVRQVYSSELRRDGQAVSLSDGPITDVVVFDVQWYSEVRIRVADVISEGSGLNLWATMGR